MNFQSFHTARITLQCYETMHAIRKGQIKEIVRAESAMLARSYDVQASADEHHSCVQTRSASTSLQLKKEIFWV